MQVMKPHSKIEQNMNKCKVGSQLNCFSGDYRIKWILYDAGPGWESNKSQKERAFVFIIRNINTWKSIYTYKQVEKEFTEKEDEGMEMCKWEFYKLNSAIIGEKDKTCRCNSLKFTNFAAGQSQLGNE